MIPTPTRHGLRLAISHPERLHCGPGGWCRFMELGLLPAVNTRHQFLRAVTRAAAGLSVEIDQRAKAFRPSTDDGDRKRETELACADERGWRATHTDPDRQRVLQRARIDRLA